MDNQPNEVDWMHVGNALRTSINNFNKYMGFYVEIPLLNQPCGIPSEEVLAEYDRVVPGSADKLREMARREMEYRLAKENN